MEENPTLDASLGLQVWKVRNDILQLLHGEAPRRPLDIFGENCKYGI
jgi:hypothetical protein